MPGTTQFTIGADASCTDGPCGEVSRVVVDPVARAVTHLVVEPRDRPGAGRLVPLDLVDAADGAVRLRCSAAEFDKLDLAEETDFLPSSGGYGVYGPEQVLAWPYYGLGGEVSMGAGFIPEPDITMETNAALADAARPVTYDSVPLGELAIRRGEHVHATDGDIGQVQGLVIGSGDGHVTHVLLQEGHLWGRKEVAIPIRAVTEFSEGNGIRLGLTKQEVQDLPAVDVDHS
jgi:hypothetical protein